MYNTFRISFRLKNAYKTNGVIFSLKSLPLIKKLLPESLYKSRGLKKLANFISGVIEFFNIFAFKMMYALVMAYLVVSQMPVTYGNAFLNAIFFYTIIGGLINTKAFELSQDKYYAIFILRMNAREYILSNQFLFFVKTFVGFLPTMLLFGLLSGLSWYICILLSVYVVMMKLIGMAFLVWYNGKKLTQKEPKQAVIPLPVAIVVIVVGLAAAIGLPALGYGMSELVFLIILGVLLIPAYFALRYIRNYPSYRAIYKLLLNPRNYVVDRAAQAQAQQALAQKNIVGDTAFKSNKTGYKYFNELFVKRHAKLLTKSAIRISLVELAVFVVLIIVSLFSSESGDAIKNVFMNNLPVFLFLMYFTNRGQVITQAMFMNCDHSMLTFRFYREPKVVLSLFRERLKSVALINLLPASVIAVFGPLTMLVAGGTAPIYYVLVFVTILAMSIFFSVHHLTLYYLLQPYNVNLEMKNATYTVLNILTYVVCYAGIQIEVPTLYFGIIMTAFSLLYALVAMILVYRFAPKTFKLRQ